MKFINSLDKLNNHKDLIKAEYGNAPSCHQSQILPALPEKTNADFLL